MARNNLKPVSVAGIEFDALIEETKSLSATVPVYPVENGFPVSDTIILNPLTVSMTLYISNTPVTWLHRHGSSNSRVLEICDLLEDLWMGRSPVKIVTTDAIYTDMGITSLSIKKSRDIGYAREVTLTAQKIRTTARQTVNIPSYLLKSGTTQASAGTASTSTSSTKAASSGVKTSKSTSSSSSKTSSGTGTSQKTGTGKSTTGSGGSASSSASSSSSSSASSSSSKTSNSSSKTTKSSGSSSSSTSSKKGASILYGAASGLGFI